VRQETADQSARGGEDEHPQNRRGLAPTDLGDANALTKSGVSR
jgi:hypothetical protein